MTLPIVPLLYLAVGGAYLVVLPALLYLYLQRRWYTARSVERLLMYFFVFLFSPVCCCSAPFSTSGPNLGK